ncbi:helix-turn-helix domain-containing protein [Yersinia ruckeri]|uniref:S24 family peptidase n=1 Tax=Yersinia ruckeri TaxID=29486 RepID=UPI00226513EB|nr:S24 family peptidase [Yersinia ruckeri]UZX96155.1 helix-turn-helix domain-containing protein [Yersinia ruckeri]
MGSTLAERVSERRLALNLSQEDLAKKAGVSRVAISKAELGLTKNFNGDTLFNVARALLCNPEWLQTGKGSPELQSTSQNNWDANVTEINRHQSAQSYEYPKISWVSAGNWCEAIEPYSINEIDHWVTTTKYAGQNAFWLDVKGDSMTSPVGLTIPEGMSILINPDAEPTSGKLVIAKLTDDNEATFKRYIEDAGNKYLKPLNPQYPMIKINGNCKIIGVVVEAKWENL